MPADAIEDLLRSAELRLAERGQTEISSSELGSWVMEFLREHDTIAFVRFASVYREFEDIGALLTEVTALADEERDRSAAASRAALDAAQAHEASDVEDADDEPTHQAP